MKRFWRNKIIRRCLGILAILFSLIATSIWFFWLVPMYERFDPVWEDGFSRKAYWKEVQKRIQRFGWFHDDFSIVGSYGDKRWAEWIMKRAEDGEEIGDCGSVGHKNSAMEFITGNNPSGTNWVVEPHWLGWWRENKDKSQTEWIQNSFKEYGTFVQMPAAHEDYEPLLRLLGGTRTNASGNIPSFIRYNAFRWLRDSGFEPIPFALSNVTAETSEIVRDGIVTYGRYDRIFSKYDGIGLLEFASESESNHDIRRPRFFDPEIQFVAWVLMSLPFLIGTILLLRSFRGRSGACGQQEVT